MRSQYNQATDRSKQSVRRSTDEASYFWTGFLEAALTTFLGLALVPVFLLSIVPICNRKVGIGYVSVGGYILGGYVLLLL